MALKYYYDLMSQPCRAVYMLLHLNKVPFEPKPIAIRKGENKTAEYKKIFPFGLVPAIEHDGLLLTESIAISKYVIQRFDLADHWFPKDLKKQAKVEEYLHWQHFNTRYKAAMLFLHLVPIPVAKGKRTDSKEIERMRKDVTTMISEMDNYFLKDTPYLSSEKISLADLFGACEMMQLNACHEQGLYENMPRVRDWMERVKSETNPYFDEAHQVTNTVAGRFHKIVSKLP